MSTSLGTVMLFISIRKSKALRVASPWDLRTGQHAGVALPYVARRCCHGAPRQRWVGEGEREREKEGGKGGGAGGRWHPGLMLLLVTGVSAQVKCRCWWLALAPKSNAAVGGWCWCPG